MAAITESLTRRTAGALLPSGSQDSTTTKQHESEAEDTSTEVQVPAPGALIWISELRELLPKGNGKARSYYPESLVFAIGRQQVLAPTCSSCGGPT